MAQLSDVDAVQYLFDRPNEPCFNRKGADGGVKFNVPEAYLLEEHKKVAIKLSDQGGTATAVYDVKPIPEKDLPNLKKALALPRDEPFSVFNEFHRAGADQLIEALMDAADLKDFNSIAVYARDRLNQYLFSYSLSIAYLHRPDTKKSLLPSHVSSFPMLYIDRAVRLKAREENNIVPPGSRIAIDISRDNTASDLDLEHKLAYFREDVGINLHHWHWHLVYPSQGREAIVKKDRRGELFYYMHQQMLARYNLERLSNSLARARPLANFYEPLEEGYYPKLDDSIASRTWPSRKPNTPLSDVNREVDRLRVGRRDLDRWMIRIFDVIESGRYQKPDGTYERLNPEGDKPDKGIDILGNMVESTTISVNRNYYGNLHNRGHTLISYVHDPEHRYLEQFGVMNDSGTAMRDPLFYRWHTTINNIFETHKNLLTPYTKDELTFENMEVKDIRLSVSVSSESNDIGKPKDNVVYTFWQQAKIELSRGLDFAENKGSVYAQVTHLQHASFKYYITILNGGSARMGTVRIFYAPKLDEQGLPFHLYFQRSLMIELDRFIFNFKSGENKIERSSKDSSITIPYEQTFRHLVPTNESSSADQAWNFCGCGWPAHMLMAKGTVSGLVCDLFVMVSDYNKDKVAGSGTAKQTCDDASSFCGVRDSLYPDKNSMGYPFDRPPRDGVVMLKDFVDNIKNMKTQEIMVKFKDDIKAPIQKAGADPILVRADFGDTQA